MQGAGCARSNGRCVVFLFLAWSALGSMRCFVHGSPGTCAPYVVALHTPHLLPSFPSLPLSLWLPDALRMILKEEGFMGLYKGLGPGLLLVTHSAL